VNDIKELIKEYEEEGNDFNNKEWLHNAAHCYNAYSLKYDESMPDSQLKCILYVLVGGEIK